MPKNIGRGGNYAPRNWAAKGLGGKLAWILVASNLFAVIYVNMQDLSRMKASV